MTLRTHLAACALLCLAAIGCAEENVEAVDPEVCASEQRWIGGNSGDSRMHPGQDCISCHLDDGPTYGAAGTAYSHADQNAGCFGGSGLTITLIGADGDELSTHTNEAGNFYFDPGVFHRLTKPYTAVVSDGVTSVTKDVPQSSGACNSCHGFVGANGADGFIHLGASTLTAQ